MPKPGGFGAGIVFLPQKKNERQKCKETVERIIAHQGQRLMGWRLVPTETEKADIGPGARATEPHIEQLFIAAGDGLARAADRDEVMFLLQLGTGPRRSTAAPMVAT